MRCKDAQDMILTGYLDDQVSSKQARAIHEHLAQCGDCKEFFERSQKILVDPFKAIHEVKVPDHVWMKIKEACQSSRRLSWADRVGAQLDIFFNGLLRIWPQFALSTVAVCCVLFLVLFQGSVFNRQQLANHFLQEQWEYFLSFDEETDSQEMVVDWEVFL